MRKLTLTLIILSIITIISIILNVYQNNKLNKGVEIDIDEIRDMIRKEYIEDLKMLSHQIVNSKNHFDTLNYSFQKVGNDYLIEIKPKGQYGSIELKEILIKFDSLGYAERIYIDNDSILRE